MYWQLVILFLTRPLQLVCSSQFQDKMQLVAHIFPRNDSVCLFENNNNHLITNKHMEVSETERQRKIEDDYLKKEQREREKNPSCLSALKLSGTRISTEHLFVFIEHAVCECTCAYLYG